MLKTHLPEQLKRSSSKQEKAYGLKIAVVGSGISGLSAAWLLSRSHEVTLFEKNNYPGGHSHTVDVKADGRTFPVDTGFIVYNPLNYPNLTALFDYLDVPTEKTEMSFGVSLKQGAFEYSGTGLSGLFAQSANLLNWRFWSMLRDIKRFYGSAAAYLQQPGIEKLTLRQLLNQGSYERSFIENHLAPMGGSIWSCSSENILDYPAAAFLRFFENHGLTKLKNRPEWRTVTGGSREYVRRLIEDFSGTLRLNTNIENIRRSDGRVVITIDGVPEEFDQVILACHSDQALSLLSDATTAETTTLGSIRYQPNQVFLHRDIHQMPRRKAAWSSWNYTGECIHDAGAPTVSYWMNRLQTLPTQSPILVTLNPVTPINPDLVLGSYRYEHPVFDKMALIAQKLLWNLQGKQNTWFCGAYFGSGFHEDGIQSGLAVAEKLSGLHRPWSVKDQNARIGLDEYGNVLAEAVI